jgi:hypothetical protein
MVRGGVVIISEKSKDRVMIFVIYISWINSKVDFTLFSSNFRIFEWKKLGLLLKVEPADF